MLKVQQIVILAATTDPADKKRGFCCHLQQTYLGLPKEDRPLWKDLVHWMRETCQEWAEFSGDIGYPVPSHQPAMGACDMYMYYNAKNYSFWNKADRYGAARHRYVQFMLHKARESL